MNSMTRVASAGTAKPVAGAAQRSSTRPSGVPRIYAVSPLLVGPLPAWSEVFGRAAALGFDSVMVASPFLPVPGHDLFRTADHDRPHPVLCMQGTADEALRRLAELARSAGVSLGLDFHPARAAADGVLAGSMAGAFEAAPGREALDPRRPPAARGLIAARWSDPAGATALRDWWSARLRRWAEAGVADLVCHGAAAVPAAVWASWVGTAPGIRFTLWGPGEARPAILAQRACGFAAVADSLAWWDGDAGWYAEELAALATVAPSVATLEVPFGQRAGYGLDPAQRGVVARQRLRFAALGGGVIMPMGFEHGAIAPMDPLQDTQARWSALVADAPDDLRADIRATNAALARVGGAGGAPVSLLGPGGPVGAMAAPNSGLLVLTNPDRHHPVSVRGASVLPGVAARWEAFADGDAAFAAGSTIDLGPGETRLLKGRPAAPIRVVAPRLPATEPRVAIEAVTPAIDDGRFPVKRVVGEQVAVEADLIADGHDRLAGRLRWRAGAAGDWREATLEPLGNDRWGARFPLDQVGRHEFVVEAWIDAFGSFRHGLEAKLGAGQTVTLEVEEGRRLVAAAGADAPELAAAAKQLEAASEGERLRLLRTPELAALMARAAPRPHSATSRLFAVEADRIGARFASWYELFPRSQSGDAARHGTFADVIRQLPRIRAMHFDVLYFPPIHPIGRAFRKGRNNTLTPGPDDVGSPYAIGSEAGGHDAIHPQLGTLADFRRLRDAAAAHGLELALDFAVQCSPDHPWLREHRDWFAWRPDGSIKYAENPPKKYQDIVNVDFHAAGAVPDLWLALRDVVRFWANEGVRLFRVDNPHTKPLPFWEWLIADIRATDPDVVFLAEAFTRPKLMYRLAKLGFGQSYTYFTWRNEKREIMDYLTELTTTAPRDFFRPHFFVNTPDINPVFLQASGRPGHLIRAALACTLSGLWGMYQGFELCEAAPLPGREEYLDSEKYEIRVWPDRAPGDIVDEITRLNLIRRLNPALHDHLGVAFHAADNERVLWYRKRSADGTNVLLIAVSLDPRVRQEATVEVPLWEWGLPDDATLEAEELMRGARATWQGKTRRIALDPADLPFAIWRVRPPGPFRPHLPPVAAVAAPTGHH